MDPTIQTEDLWKRFDKCLRSFIRKRVNNDADADEILQEVFTRIHAHLAELKNTENVQAWVFRITRNAITDHYHARKRLPGGLEEAPEPAAGPGRAGNEDDQSASADLSRCMMLLLEELPEPYGEAVMLAELGSLSQKELSQRMGISYSGMKSRVQRGRDQLKSLLLTCCEVERDTRGGIIGFTPRSASSREKCDCEDPPSGRADAPPTP
ncbi:MAG: RNA polymerase sigma factor SigZ [Planctomycetota bacterium]|jgi:RNA polymerase sigma-70 factor (ECF subfamily)